MLSSVDPSAPWTDPWSTRSPVASNTRMAPGRAVTSSVKVRTTSVGGSSSEAWSAGSVVANSAWANAGWGWSTTSAPMTTARTAWRTLDFRDRSMVDISDRVLLSIGMPISVPIGREPGHCTEGALSRRQDGRRKGTPPRHRPGTQPRVGSYLLATHQPRVGSYLLGTHQPRGRKQPRSGCRPPSAVCRHSLQRPVALQPHFFSARWR